MRVPIGFVVRAHGIQGWVRVRAEGGSLPSLSKVFVDGHERKILQLQPERGEFLVLFEGVADRNAAEALKSAEISAERDQLPPPSVDEVYLSDLIGCRVVDGAGRALGEVVALDSNGAQALLTIARTPFHGEDREGRTWQLPFVDGIVTSVDLAAKQIVCDPPEGLLDL